MRTSARLVVVSGLAIGGAMLPSLHAQVFLSRQVQLGGSAQGVAIGDVNGDGSRDLAACWYGGTITGVSVSIVTAGVPGTPVNYGLTGIPSAVALADLTGDLRPELVVTIADTGKVGVLVNDGTGAFGVPALFTIGATPGPGAYDVAVADLDHDSKLDVVTGNAWENTVSVLLGNGLGQLGSLVNLAATNYPHSVAIGDMNNDGNADLLATANFPDNGLNVYLGNGTGGFARQPLAALGASPADFVLVDANEDGQLDALVADEQALRVAIGNGTGGFASVTALPAGTDPIHIAAADLNGDGHVDAVTTHLNAFEATSLRGNGAGGFTSPAQVACGGTPMGLALGDLGGDGVADLVVANGAPITPAIGFLTLLPGSGTGSFAGGGVAPLGNVINPLALVAADFDSDGDVDLAAASESSAMVSVVQNTGVGSFGAPAQSSTGPGPTAMSCGDVDGDSRLDLVTVNTNANTLSVLRGNGAGGFMTAVNYATGFTPKAAAVADFNGDGRADVAAATFLGASLAVHLASAGGALGTPTNYPLVNYGTFVTQADVNGDAKWDLVVGTNVPASPLPTGEIRVFLGNGAGLFSAGTALAIARPAAWIVSGDWNEDGKIDLAAAMPFSRSVSIFLGNGAGAFSLSSAIAVADSPVSLAAGELDGDGNLDLVVVDEYHANLALLLGNGLGAFSVASWHALHGAAGSVALADVNGDGLLDAEIGLAWPGASASILVNQKPAAFKPYGTGCAGSGGFTPLLKLTGSATPGGSVTMTVSRGLGAASAPIYLGTSEAAVPIPGGCTFLVGNLLPLFPTLLLFGSGPGNGTAFFGGPLPISTPIGFQLTTQAFVYDSGVPRGYASSNGVKMTVMP